MSAYPPEEMRAYPRGLGRLHRDEDGQIVYLTLASVVTFVAAAALIINSGHMVTRKLETQNAADAAVASASTVIARGMNVISINNVAMTELLGLTVVLRALKQTWSEGARQATAILNVLRTVCPQLASNPYTAALAAPCYAYQAAVQVVETDFNFRLRLFGTVIDYATNPNGGALWQAMNAMSFVSQSIAASFPVLAIDVARRIGEANKAEGLLLTPLLPEIPAEQGRFSDLCHPTREGSPGEYPDGLRRGYFPFLNQEYDRFNKGPLIVYRDIANGTWLQMAFNILLRSSPMPQNTDAEFGRYCRGSPAGDYQSNRSRPLPHLIAGTGRSTNTSVASIEGARGDLNHLVVAWQSSHSAFMPARFENPRERVCAYGQARVFNGTSFDLFTPDWRVKLVKADLLDEGSQSLVALGAECRQIDTVLAARSLNLH